MVKPKTTRKKTTARKASNSKTKSKRLANEMFAGNSRFLKSEDIGRRRIPVTIAEVGDPDPKMDGKVPIYFEEDVKPLLCNITNWKALGDALGHEVDTWPGNQIVLFTAPTTTPSGDPTRGVRVDILEDEADEEELESENDDDSLE